VTLVAIIADTHIPRGGRRLSPECLDVLAHADVILHGGDLTAAQVLAELRAFAPVRAVRGNMDDAELKASLPDRLVHEVEGVRIGMIHDAGLPTSRRERLGTAFPRCEVVVYAHTHVPEVARHEGLGSSIPAARRSAARPPRGRWRRSGSDRRDYTPS
jgi:putative phosphoesterase